MPLVSETTTERRGPLVIAHGGASDAMPENTIAAFERALEEGADALALSVHLSADDQPVVIQDFTLERTTDGAGPVRSATVRQLKRLDAGGWRGQRYRGQRIQTLQEVFERFRDRTCFWLDLKGGPALYAEIEERVLSTVEIYETLERTLVFSPDATAPIRLRQLSAQVRLGARPDARSLRALMIAPGPLQAVCPQPELLSEITAEEIRAAGLECYAGVTGEPAFVDRLAAWGIDGILTDRPSRVRARLGR